VGPGTDTHTGQPLPPVAVKPDFAGLAAGSPASPVTATVSLWLTWPMSHRTGTRR